MQPSPLVRPMKYRHRLSATNEAAAEVGGAGTLRVRIGSDQTRKVAHSGLLSVVL